MAEESGEQINETENPPKQNDSVSPKILPWDKFSSWIHCVCIVKFDLELGPAMEVRVRAV